MALCLLGCPEPQDRLSASMGPRIPWMGRLGEGASVPLLDGIHYAPMILSTYVVWKIPIYTSGAPRSMSRVSSRYLDNLIRLQVPDLLPTAASSPFLSKRPAFNSFQSLFTLVSQGLNLIFSSPNVMMAFFVPAQPSIGAWR